MTGGSGQEGAVLLEIARAAVEEAVTGRTAGMPGSAASTPGEPHRASFVTLTRNGALRGCIGTLEPCRPLGEDVRRNARAAALHDTRFGPVQPEELQEISVEVSVLSPLEELEHDSEEELLSLLEPGVDGLVIAHEGHRATFLPQVWRSLPRAPEFLQALKAKAGLLGVSWAKGFRAWRFGVREYHE